MISKATIDNKISAIKKYRSILKRYNEKSRDEIENDVDTRGAVERYLYLTIQATIDLAEAIIADRSLRKPSTMSEAFHVLTEENIIPIKLEEKMIQMTGFRNVIAHNYDTINYDIVYNVLHQGVKDIEEFIDIIETEK